MEAEAQPPPPPSCRLMILAWFGWWVLSMLSILSFLTLPLMVWLLVLTVRRRNVRPLWVIALSPVLVLFVVGATSWFGVRPCFLCNGLPGAQFGNLNRDTRCYWSSMGCCVDGSEWLRQEPWNMGLRLMNSVFGLPPQTYHGTYPTKEEADQLTQNGAVIPLRSFRGGRIEVAGAVCELPNALCKQMEQDLAYWDWDPFPNALSKPQIKAATVGNDCLLIRFTNGIAPTDAIFVLDRQKQKPIARYVMVPGSVSRFAHYLRP